MKFRLSLIAAALAAAFTAPAFAAGVTVPSSANPPIVQDTLANGNLAIGGASAAGTLDGTGADSTDNTTAQQDTAVGIGAQAQGLYSTALGANAQALADQSLALGVQAQVGTGQTNSVAIGYASSTNAANQVSIGMWSSANNAWVSTRTLTGLSGGMINANSADAINGAQMYANNQSLAGILGGNYLALGSNPGFFWSTTIQGQNYSSVSSAFGAVDSQLTSLNQQVASLSSASTPPTSSAGATTTSGSATTSSGAGAQATTAPASLVGTGGNINIGGVAAVASTSTSGSAASGSTSGAAAPAAPPYSQTVAIGAGSRIVMPSTLPAGAATIGAVAIGSGAQANADPATAVGFQSNASGADSVAVGANSAASGAQAVALGSNAQAKGDNSAAIGAGSVANRANSVSVGSSTQQRQITNVAAGTATTDAVNLGQMQSAISGAAGQVQGQISQAQAAAVQQSNAYTDQQISKVGTAVKAYTDAATAAALANAQPQFAPGKTHGVGVRLGHYGNANALGISYGQMFDIRGVDAIASVGVSRAVGGNSTSNLPGLGSADQTAISAGVSISW